MEGAFAVISNFRFELSAVSLKNLDGQVTFASTSSVHFEPGWFVNLTP